jgi:hypothetical protein
MYPVESNERHLQLEYLGALLRRRLSRMLPAAQRGGPTYSPPLAADTQLKLRQVEKALSLLNRGLGDNCERCGDPIGAERLACRPQLTSCARCESSSH